MARALRVSGLVLMLLVCAFGLLWAAAEAMADPGGWLAVALTAAWLVPLLLLTGLALWRPELAQPVILVVAVLLGLVLVFSAVAQGTWSDLENHVGPFRAVGLLALALPTAVLAWHRPLTGGSVLLALGALATVLGMVLRGRVGGSAALGVVALPIVLSGALFLLSTTVQGAGGAPRLRKDTALPTDVRRE